MPEDKVPQFDPEKHAYSMNGVPIPSVTQILHSAGIVNTAFFNEAAAWRGSIVHRCCELDDLGTLDEVTVADEAWPYLLAWRQFRKDSRFVPDLIEQRVFHKTWMYAGTLDRTGHIGEQKVLIDLKTGAPQRWHELQTAAYAFTLENPRLYRRFVVGLRRDGTYSTKEFAANRVDYDFGIFTAVHMIAGWMGNGKH